MNTMIVACKKWAVTKGYGSLRRTEIDTYLKEENISLMKTLRKEFAQLVTDKIENPSVQLI